MIADGQVVGLLDLKSYHKEAYLEEDGEWLSVVANQIGLSIRNAQLFAQIQQRIAEMLVTHDIDRVITTTDFSENAFDFILGHIATQPHVDAVDIYFFDPQEKTLTFTSGYGFNHPPTKNHKIQLGEGIIGKVATERQPVRLLDLSKQLSDFEGSPLWEIECFIAYLGLPLVLHGDLKGVLQVYSRDPIPDDPDWLHFVDSLAQQVAIAVDNYQLFHGLQKANIELLQAYDATIAGWSQAMDLRDKDTEGHTERVTEITLKIARVMGLSEDKLVHVRRGALLHDIGKLGIPDQILHKPGSLTDEEWVMMKKHPFFAHEMLSKVEYLRPAMTIPYSHHEKWDGTGYPRGLKGEEIPLEARIFAVVDVWDALTSDRPYRKAWTREEALQYIQDQRGKYFDPQIVDVFLRHMAGEHA
jgi:putative nucleotidyltransferase with HDIG domain